MTPPSTLPEDKPTSSSSTASTSPENEQTDSLSVLDLSAAGLLAQKVTGRENKMMKAARLLVTGRLRVLRVSRELILAECRGDSGEVYNLGWRDQRWSCSCPARTDCSHLNALWSVCAVSK